MKTRKYAVVTVLALLGILGGVLGPLAYGAFANTSARDRIAADPPPALFPDATVAPIGQQIRGQSVEASKLMRTWWDGHDSGPHDLAFQRWLEATLPGPPSSAVRAREIKAVQALAPKRTPTGVAAATWLEAHGKKDVWKLYAHDQAEVLPTGQGDARKQDVKDMLSMSKTVADTLGTRYGQSAPYVIDPSLRPDHAITKGQICPCSYPSRHATAGAAASTYLSALVSHQGPEYRWMEDEIAYSRIYMAGHVSSDITGGALLGDMIGEYFLTTRRHASVSRRTDP